jgi:hypothetical protein
MVSFPTGAVPVNALSTSLNLPSDDYRFVLIGWGCKVAAVTGAASGSLAVNHRAPFSVSSVIGLTRLNLKRWLALRRALPHRLNRLGSFGHRRRS